MAATNAASKVFKCRKTFKIENSVVNFYPGHMTKGMNKMQGKLGKVDCFLEIHDARIPFSGRNRNFYQKLTAIRPHILLLNKMDLSNKEQCEEIRSYILQKEPYLADVMWTNSTVQYHKSIKAIVPRVIKAIEEKAFHTPKSDRNLMIIGVPNTGKSSVINALRRVNVRKGNVAPAADFAGVTRAVQERIKLFDLPPTYVLDTPGILTPKLDDIETTMRLAACGCFKDSVIGEEHIVDYLLYFFNKRGMFQYVVYFGLEEPTDDVYVLLTTIARNLNLKRLIRQIATRTLRSIFDTNKAANYFLTQYRKGNLGFFSLDDDKLEAERLKYTPKAIAAKSTLSIENT